MLNNNSKPSRTCGIHDLWIPAFAGMTQKGAGMTRKDTGMTRKDAGITLPNTKYILMHYSKVQIRADVVLR
jgi:hypothetical protein